MGNTIRQIDDKIQRDKKSRVHHSLVDQFEQQSSYSQSIQQSSNSKSSQDNNKSSKSSQVSNNSKIRNKCCLSRFFRSPPMIDIEQNQSQHRHQQQQLRERVYNKVNNIMRRQQQDNMNTNKNRLLNGQINELQYNFINYGSKNNYSSFDNNNKLRKQYYNELRKQYNNHLQKQQQYKNIDGNRQVMRQKYRQQKYKFKNKLYSFEQLQFKPIKYNWQQFLFNQSNQYLQQQKNKGYINNNYRQLNILLDNKTKLSTKQIYISQQQINNILIPNNNNNFLNQSNNTKLIIVQKIIIQQHQLNKLFNITKQQLKINYQINSIEQYNLIKSHQIKFMKQIHNLINQWRIYIAAQSIHNHNNTNNIYSINNISQPYILNNYSSLSSLPIIHLYQLESSNINISFSPQLILCSPKIIIYQQLIIYHIYDIKTLSHLQGLYVLQACLLGFMMLYQIFGFFIITQPMIGINCNGQIKVWISPIKFSNLPNRTFINYSKYHMNNKYNINNKNQMNNKFNLNKQYNGKNNKNINFNNTQEYKASQSMDKLYEQQQMVSMIWMIVQKYALFHQSLVVQSKGFRHIGFRQSLQIILRHKCKIIQNRSPQLGLVLFINRLQFVSKEQKQKNKYQNNNFYQNNIHLNKKQQQQVINKQLQQQLNKIKRTYKQKQQKQKKQIQQIIRKNKQLLNKTSDNKYQIREDNTNKQQKNKVNINKQYRDNNKSHIIIIQRSKQKLNNNKYHKQYKINQQQNKKRPLIFDQGYNHSMSNNLYNSNQSIHSSQKHYQYQNNQIFYKNQSNTNYKLNNHPKINNNSHAQFITIKSIK